MLYRSTRRPLPYNCLLLQVYQIISPYTSRLDNVLELYTGAPLLAPANYLSDMGEVFVAYTMLSNVMSLDQTCSYFISPLAGHDVQGDLVHAHMLSTAQRKFNAC